MLIDSHCHLEAFKNIGEVIRESRQMLEAVITCGHSVESSRQSIQIAKEYEGFVYPVVGVGPQAAMKMRAKDWKFNIPDSAVAIGEIGLDYHWAKTGEEKQLQKECFEHFIDIAIQTDLPIIIHSRDSQSDVIRILEDKSPKDVCWHCFSGSVEDAEWAVKQGHSISFIPIQSKTRAEAARLPGIRIMLETDAPYIGKKPTDVVKSAELVAGYRKTKLEEIEKEAGENTRSFFRI